MTCTGKAEEGFRSDRTQVWEGIDFQVTFSRSFLLLKSCYFYARWEVNCHTMVASLNNMITC